MGRGSRCRRTGMAPELPGSRRTCPSKEERNLMRRASTCLAVLGLAALSLTGVASAAPTVTLKAKAVPIPGFPHTGNHKGVGAAAQAEFTISGTEYGGFPPPLIGVNFFLPTGSKIHSAGFKTCSKPVLELYMPSECPEGSAAG